MSSERSEKAYESLLINEESVFEGKDIEPNYLHYKHRLEALHDYEVCVDQAVESGFLTFDEGTIALRGFIAWVQECE